MISRGHFNSDKSGILPSGWGLRGSEVLPGSILSAVTSMGLEQEKEFGTGPQSLPPYPCGGILAVFGTRTSARLWTLSPVASS